MAVYSKETALFKNGAIDEAIQEAGSKAESYITTVGSNGIFVHTEGSPDAQHPETSGNYGVHISDNVDIIRNGQTVASYGEEVTIGRDGEANFYQDYHSIQFKDGNDRSYFHVSDLVNRDGYIVDEFICDGERDWYEFAFTPLQVTVEIDDVLTTDYDITAHGIPGPTIRYRYTLTFDEVPSDGSVVKIEYTTSPNANTKAYTFGTRSSNSVTGGYSICEGRDNEASGEDSHAEGYSTIASGYESHAEGCKTKAIGSYSHAGGLGTISDQNYQTAIGRYNKSGETGSLFSVGCGDNETSRDTAFAVRKSSNDDFPKIEVHGKPLFKLIKAHNLETSPMLPDSYTPDDIQHDITSLIPDGYEVLNVTVSGTGYNCVNVYRLTWSISNNRTYILYRLRNFNPAGTGNISVTPYVNIILINKGLL